MRINIKPLSVNEAWQGRRYKTDKYNAYSKLLSLHLKPFKIDFKGDLSVHLIFGFSSHGADIDNPVKPILDVMQKKFGFNDNRIYELNIKKEIVKKGNEFIDIDIRNIK